MRLTITAYFFDMVGLYQPQLFYVLLEHASF